MKYIIAVSGKLGSGKTTFCNFLESYLNNHYIVSNIAFADILKRDVAKRYNVTREFIDSFKGKKIETLDENNGKTFGKILQDTATEKRNEDSDYYARSLCDYIRTLDSDIIIVSDLRYKNELEHLQNITDHNIADAINDNIYKLITVRINGDPMNIRKNNLTGRDLNHQSETDLDDYYFSLFIDNNYIKGGPSFNSAVLAILMFISEG